MSLGIIHYIRGNLCCKIEDNYRSQNWKRYMYPNVHHNTLGGHFSKSTPKDRVRPKSLFLAFKALHNLVLTLPDLSTASHVPGILDTWNYLPLLNSWIFYLCVFVLSLPLYLTNVCWALQIKARIIPAPLPHQSGRSVSSDSPQLSITTSIRDLILYSRTYLSASILRSQASKG